MSSARRGSQRRYDRFHPLTQALDVVGDRWTLLIVFAMLHEPKRYSELKRDLAGAGSNILADRLRLLSANGIVGRSTGDTPGSDITYHLTERGRDLAPALENLAMWGMRFLWHAPDDRGEARVFDQSWTVDPSGETNDESYQWTVDGTTFELAVRGSNLVQRLGRVEQPVVSFKTSSATYQALMCGRLSVADALGRGEVQIKGSKSAIRRMFAIIGLGDIEL